jgi:hypothetical protein
MEQNSLIDPKWLKRHLKKYPDGKLPEQRITVNIDGKFALSSAGELPKSYLKEYLKAKTGGCK